MSRIWTIARRELRALLDHPTGYVLLVIFVAVNAFLFFRQAYVFGVASLRPMLQLLPWVFLFFVPAVTMRALAEDARSGLLEVVLAQPVTELELLLGKYLGAVLFLWLGLALTLPIPFGLALGADLQVGPIVAQYVGAALLAAGLAGVGVWASSLTRSQITAFIAGAAVMFVLVLVGLDPLIVGLPPLLGAVAARLGVLSHFESIARGVIDLRDVIYFASLAGIFLALAYGALAGRKLARGGGAARRLRAGVALLTATLIVVNLLGSYIGGRLDLTPGHAYTLSRATTQIVRNLDDIVTIKLFASDELPTSVALLERDVNDLLRDLRAAGRGKIRVVTRDPSKDETARRDAESLGIQPVQFNVVGQSELQVKQGYLGLAVQYGGRTEAIPFVQQTDNLEYRLASAIRSLTRAKKPVVGVIAEVTDPSAGVQELEQQLGKSYEVRPISLSDTTQPATDVAALVLVGAPDSLPAAAAQRIRAFLERGGSALVLASGMQLSPQVPIASPHPVAWNEVLKPFHVAVRSDMVYDLAANAVVPVRVSFGQLLQRYPFFVRAQSTGKSPVNQELGDVLVMWPSSIDTTGAVAGTITPLLVTSRASGLATGPTTIDPTRDYPQTNLAPQLLAVQVVPSAAKDSTVRGRVIVVGDESFATDRFVQNAPDNLAFVLNAVDWLAQDESLIAIRAKDRRPPALAFTSAGTRDGVKYVNVIGVPALIALAGVLRLLHRRQRTREPYRPIQPQPVRAA
ncbi:MAG: Gldg family protein [Gemmatimonadaceae bacterium]|nr:Gldg family protein [Gemmatimonadaceae bacterium]